LSGPDNSLGLYVHLPWCERKCPYCDFNSHESAAIPEGNYVAALLRDLEGEAQRAAGRTVGTVFIGGGTPSLFSADAIARLLEGVAQRLNLAREAEITLEANPGSADMAKFAAFRAAGVNRLSLGIQSFDDARLAALGRIHDSATALAAVDAARRAGFDNINLDLMHGLPGQSAAGGLADLKQAIALAPEHLSWYQLTIEPNTAFYRRPPELPLEDTLETLEHEGHALLEDAAYRRYEVSAFARPGRECRHNLNYWRFGDYLAIGAGAHGKLGVGPGAILRYAKLRQPQSYLNAAAGAMQGEARHITGEELAGEFMLNALRLTAGVPRASFSERTGLPWSQVAGRVDALVDRGLLAADTRQLRTTELGLRFLDSVVGSFFPE
jgi:oxygen-independent coproporphyrinogen-3 oxidase